MAQQASPGAGFLGQSRSEYAVFIIGDSLAAGLWAGSRRAAKSVPRLKIKGRFKEGSGLARPQFHDWVTAIPRIIERNPTDIAVVLIGTNDSQPVRVSGETLEFGSPQWTKYYERRVDQVISVFKSSKIAVYWVELPPIGTVKHDKATKKISQIHRARVAAAGMRFVEIRKPFANEDDTYTDKGFDVGGQFRRLRAHNGIHFLKSGNTKLAKLVVDAISRDIEVSDGLRTPDNTPQASGPSDLPIFGHALSSGEAFVLQPADLPKPGAIAIARNTSSRNSRGNDAAGALTSEAVIENLRATAVPGSAAGRLFNDGEWPQTPAGRLDDFSWPDE